jgi:RNA polymerase sigma-70 factor (ECF subfamily)
MRDDKRGSVAAIGRDPDALEAFYREHVEAVGRFVARRVDDPQWAADLTTDIFLAAFDAAESYRPDRGSPVGWMYGIARNVLADQMRRRARVVYRFYAGFPADRSLVIPAYTFDGNTCGAAVSR